MGKGGRWDGAENGGSLHVGKTILLDRIRREAYGATKQSPCRSPIIVLFAKLPPTITLLMYDGYWPFAQHDVEIAIRKVTE